MVDVSCFPPMVICLPPTVIIKLQFQCSSILNCIVSFALFGTDFKILAKQILLAFWNTAFERILNKN